MKATSRTLAALLLVFLAGRLAAQEAVPQPRIHMLPANRPLSTGFAPAAGLAGTDVTDHGGPVIAQATVVFIFWGPHFAAGGTDHNYATTLQAFRGIFGTSQEYKVLGQYGVNPSNLAAGTPDWFDTSTPPTDVTDAEVQAEVGRYLESNAFSADTVYEVVIPSASYSSIDGEDSCGGPSLAYCAYYSSYTSGSDNVIYSIQPYASCAGCQVSGWTPAQNEEHFVGQETIDAVTDPLGTGWWDSRTGENLADLCAWSPSPYLMGGYAYQYVWSNKADACVK
jgi:hypothetical protein